VGDTSAAVAVEVDGGATAPAWRSPVVERTAPPPLRDARRWWSGTAPPPSTSPGGGEGSPSQPLVEVGRARRNCRLDGSTGGS